VPPPYRGEAKPQPRKISAAALDDGLADDKFWDGENSVRLLTELHIATAAGFLAIVLAVTAKMLTASGSAHAIAWWRVAVGAGAVAVGCAVAYLSLDALDILGGKLGDRPRGSPRFLLLLPAAALVSSGVFAWLQPGSAGVRAVALPGMASVIRWTVQAGADQTWAGSRRSPGPGSCRVHRWRPAGCCGASSSRRPGWCWASGSCTDSRRWSSATSESAWPAWCCRC
jgi:hypothetical protein